MYKREDKNLQIKDLCKYAEIVFYIDVIRMLTIQEWGTWKLNTFISIIINIIIQIQTYHSLYHSILHCITFWRITINNLTNLSAI